GVHLALLDVPATRVIGRPLVGDRPLARVRRPDPCDAEVCVDCPQAFHDSSGRLRQTSAIQQHGHVRTKSSAVTVRSVGWVLMAAELLTIRRRRVSPVAKVRWASVSVPRTVKLAPSFVVIASRSSEEVSTTTASAEASYLARYASTVPSASATRVFCTTAPPPMVAEDGGATREKSGGGGAGRGDEPRARLAQAGGGPDAP